MTKTFKFINFVDFIHHVVF